MPTKKKSKTKKKPNTNLKFTVAVDWHGDYFENRDALCDLFPKYESGSGVGFFLVVVFFLVGICSPY